MAGEGPRSEAVDAYIARQADFARPILEHVRALYHQAGAPVNETIKWGIPYFEHDGPIGGIAAFKRHVAVGFWKGQLMTDPLGLFEGDTVKQLSAIKAHSLEDLPRDALLLGYIREGIELNQQGVRARTPSDGDRPELTVPTPLAEALAERPEALRVFEGFSYSKRRDYVDWIAEAKQPATVARRVEQALAWLAEGKPRNWKYMKAPAGGWKA